MIIGTGHAALSAGALLARAGEKVCLLEAHDTPGGYAHTFHEGDFKFCAQVHYIKKLGLEKELTFERMGTEGYDLVSLPDGNKVFIPHGFDLREYGFGDYNIWHCGGWDMNQVCREMKEGNFNAPWLFLSTPTLHTSDPGNSPNGQQILEIGALMDYKYFKKARKEGEASYLKLKNKVAERMLDIVEENYIPNLGQHIEVKIVGSPLTNEDFVLAPYGNTYGAELTPNNIVHRLKAETPFDNFWWCNATAGWPGLHGTLEAGTDLYKKLTGDDAF